MRFRKIWPVALLALHFVVAHAAEPAVVHIDMAHPLQLPSRSHFVGANLQLFYTGTSYLDPKMQEMAGQLHLGWTRFPAGTVDDVYDWRTGDLREEWITKFKSIREKDQDTFVADAPITRGKGLNKLEDYASFLATQNTGVAPTHTIGVINTFTDSPASAAELVRAAQQKHLNVDVWELGNEPYFFPNLYPSATAYLDLVAPFATAMKKADPTVKVAVYLQRNNTWIAQMASYKNRFWDQVYWHAYPEPKEGTQAEKLAFYNAFLANTTTHFVDDQLVPLFGPGLQLEVSEFNIGALRGGLYAAVFIAEFTLRMSSDPHVTQVGMHTLIGREDERDAAILARNAHIDDALAAYKAGKTIDTAHLDFGYYFTPDGLAMKLVDGVINTSTAILPTTVSGGGDVAATGSQIPALYAQAYTTPDAQHLLLTNKSSWPQSFSISLNGKPLVTEFTITTLGGDDPLAKNTKDHPSAVSLQHATAHDTLTIPPYGVMDASWKQ